MSDGVNVGMRLTHGDVDVLEAARDAIAQLHRLGIPYADLFSPLHDDGLNAAMRRLTIQARGEPLGDDILEVVSPPVYGRYILQYSTDVTLDKQRFAKRHGMGHVAAGHVHEVNYLARTAQDWHTHEERVCDLFALADVIPLWQIEAFRKMHMSWRAIAHDVARTLRQLTMDWPDDRVNDRAQLRVALYRHHSL